MNQFQFDIGPNAEGVGILWIIAHYFGGLISGFIVLAVAGIIGLIIYWRYKANQPQFTIMPRETLWQKIMRLLNF
jgi:hypothetical protein